MFVVLCTLLGSTTYGQAKTNPQEGIEFSKVISRYDNGMVRHGNLAKNTTIMIDGNPYTLAADERLYFYESGKVMESGHLSTGHNRHHLVVSRIPSVTLPLLLSGKVEFG